MARLSQSELLADLTRIVGEARISSSQADRVAYSADFWPKAQLWKMAGQVDRYPPDCIVWPETIDEICALVRYCNEHSIPVIPYGGGSGVCGGTVPLYGGVVIDLKRMRHISAVNEAAMSVSVQAGCLGQHFEDALNAQGFTLGHFPSSIMCSTVGGWLAARSAGQFSSKYGKIEDMVLGLTVVLADGTVLDTRGRGPGAPDWTQLFVGSEGTLGIIVAAEVRISHKPTALRLRAFNFRSVSDGLRGMRSVMQSGLSPVVLRLYDPFDSFIALGRKREAEPIEPESKPNTLQKWLKRPVALLERTVDSLTHSLKRTALASGLSVPGLANRLANSVPTGCLLIVGFEAAAKLSPEESEAELAADMAQLFELLEREGGKDLGARLGEAWLQKRYDVGFKQTQMMNLGAWVDTMEVATTWDRLEDLYEQVRVKVGAHAFVMAHFSHAYREGCSIYFTMAGHQRDPRRAELHYERTWDVALDTVLSSGGSLSHHHGVGVHKMAAMGREHGGMLKAWRALKETLDPHHIMNPGKLFPSELPNEEEGVEMDLRTRHP